MPLVQVKVIEGVFSDAQKRAMIEKVTDAMVSVEGENMRQVTWVTIEDVKSGEWGIGGKALTTEAVKDTGSGEVTLRPTRTTEMISVVRVGFLFVG